MPNIRGSVNSIHSDFKIFGATGSTYYRDANGLIAELVAGATGQQLGISAGGLPIWINPSVFSLADKAVTLAKIQDFPTGTILGRATTGAGVSELLNSAQVFAILGLNSAATRQVGAALGNLPDIKANGKLDPLVIPNVSIGSGQVVATNAAKLALTNVAAGESLVRVVTDESRGGKGSAYIYIGGTTTAEASWLLLSDEQVDAADIVSGIIDVARLPVVSPLLPVSVSAFSSGLLVNYRYYSNGANKPVFTLPSIAPLGSRIEITDISGLSFRIAQLVGQSIRFMNAVTTSGTSGYIEPTADSTFASVKIECTQANTTWQVVDSTGNFTIFN